MTGAPSELALIFLAEDNPADVYLVKEALRENGVTFRLDVAEDGRQAMSFLQGEGKFAENEAPDLILLDLNLPQHDGARLLRYIRGNNKLSSVPVVVFTSSDSPGDRLAALEAGATRYIRKPSSLSEFMAVGACLREMLEHPDPDHH